MFGKKRFVRKRKLKNKYKKRKCGRESLLDEESEEKGNV